MTVVPQTRTIRRIVIRNFLEFGLQPCHLLELREKIRINRGRYVARTYRAGNLMAMWLVGYGLLQVYDDEGNILRSVNLLEELKEAAA
jgi:hypothetical protein